MGIEDLKLRFKSAAVQLVLDLNVIQFPALEYDVKRQLVRSCSSAAANYRAACRAKSRADFIYKLKIVEEETDETLFWLEFLRDLGTTLAHHESSEKEYKELLAITVSSIKTSKSKLS